MVYRKWHFAFLWKNPLSLFMGFERLKNLKSNNPLTDNRISVRLSCVHVLRSRYPPGFWNGVHCILMVKDRIPKSICESFANYLRIENYSLNTEIDLSNRLAFTKLGLYSFSKLLCNCHPSPPLPAAGTAWCPGAVAGLSGCPPPAELNTGQ